MARKQSARQPRRPTPPKKNYCFACGPDNPGGMHLKFTYDSAHRRFLCRFRLSQRYAGPPGHCHGGIIATILDDAMSKLNKPREVTAATAKMTVEYLRPVPLNESLQVESRELSKRGRRLVRTAEITGKKGQVLARGRAVFVIVDPDHVFRKA